MPEWLKIRLFICRNPTTRHHIVITPLEELVIERYGDYDRNTTRISDQSYADMYSVGQRRQEVDKERSLTARMEKARAASEKRNEGRAVISKVRRKGMEI